VFGYGALALPNGIAGVDPACCLPRGAVSVKRGGREIWRASLPATSDGQAQPHVIGHCTSATNQEHNWLPDQSKRCEVLYTDSYAVVDALGNVNCISPGMGSTNQPTVAHPWCLHHEPRGGPVRSKPGSRARLENQT
jgi:hypothetical protein